MTRPEEVRDEMLMALADNELSAAEAAALRRVIASDAELARRFAAFERGRSLLQAAFPAEPVPEEMVAAVRRAAAEAASERGESGKVIALPRRATAAPAWGLALAASLVLAVGAFWAGRSGVPVGPVPGEASGAALAALSLSESLTGESAALPDGRTARALASFETDIGLCRLIGIDDGRLIACRSDGAGDGAGDWTIALSIAAGEGGGFVPASDSVVAVIDQMLDAINAGPNLDPEDEARALGL
jgi:hypothetical protein